MIAYVFDTGVILRTLLPPALFPDDLDRSKLTKQRIEQFVIPQWVRGEANLLVPNFIVAEVLKKMAEFFMFDESKSIQSRVAAYTQAKDIFIRWIQYKTIFDEKRDAGEVNKFFNYELNRHHILNLDKIFEFDYGTSPLYKTDAAGNKRLNVLSSPDALVVSVGVELQRLFGNQNVFILTLDGKLEKVCRTNRPKLPHGIYVATDRCPKEEDIFPRISKKGNIVYKCP